MAPQRALARLTIVVAGLTVVSGLSIGLTIALLGGAFGPAPWWLGAIAVGAALAILAVGAWRLGRFTASVANPLLEERKRLEEVRRDFVANVSHELKTPLTAARGLVETMIDDPAMDPDTRLRYLQKVRDHTHRMSELVTDLISLSRLEGAAKPLERAALDLRGVAIEALRMVKTAADQRRVSIRMTLTEAPLVVTGDEAALEQALVNLLDNAIKYSPPAGQIDLVLAAEGAHAVAAVSDHGSGIAPEHRERIFERFYRVDRARSRELGGTGLGLAIVKHTALAHGGDVSLESQLGVGSTFRLRLPRENGAPAPAASA